ncbi:30 kDa heat shock protein [Podospora aff. communis PSN243]|uniref:30 kDa heat shock protein n=1 Tax=Podospora aff. communis PSN243 TaxID=3040156 RepID=A0AAV9GJ54_9PEZI|nr:30 kDa heat shock protein [Podospora aff. communis PSN243]
MLSFFANPYYAAPAPEPSFTTLFRLLDDFDSYSREPQAPQCHPQQCKPQQRRPIRRTVTTTFRPKFDVHETATAYELHGELPGIEKENLNIEFTDPQTMVVRGRVERTSETKPEAEEQAATTNEPEAAPAAEEKTSDADETASNASSHGWHHATVEDDPEEPATPPGASTPTESETPKTEVAKRVAPTVQKAPAPAEPKEKVWLHERSIGQFSRTFTFPSRVEHENVSASLDNGVLSIVVPKAPKHQLRRIAIF